MTNLKRRKFIKICGASILGLVFSPLLQNKLLHESKSLRKYYWNGHALGANMSLTLIHDDKIKAEKIINLAINEINRLENYFSIYKPISIISQLNQNNILKNAPKDFYNLIEKSIFFSDITDGYFDITVQSLWNKLDNKFKKPTKHNISYKDIYIDGKNIVFMKPNMKITLNGIAQGYITDKIKQIFIENNIQSSLIELGEKYAIGSKNKNGWNIAIENPENNKIIDQITLQNKAIAVSSNYGGYFNEMQNHIINPHNFSFNKNIKLTYVISDSATTADALSTAVVSSGTKEFNNRIFNSNTTCVII